jgi:hypothetical protein
MASAPFTPSKMAIERIARRLPGERAGAGARAGVPAELTADATRFAPGVTILTAP